MASTFSMPSTDYDIMLQEVSNHLSRSQLLRRLSTHSSSTSSSSKRAPARIMKQNSAGNSPHHVQRRRTTANAARTYPRLSQSSPYQAQEQGLGNYRSQQAMPVERPMSWHPGSDMISTPATQVSTSEPALGNTIAGLQNLAVSGQTASSVQQSIENAFVMSYGIPISRPLTMYEQSPTGSQDYEPAPESIYRPESSFSSEPIYDPYSYNTFQHFHDSHIPQQSTQSMCPANYQLPQWPEAQPFFPNDFQYPYTSADLCQWPSQNGQSSVKTAPQVSKRATKVLSGIGLYDDKLPDGISGTSGDPSRGSMGKGLKLEETWQPPKDDDENDEDDEGSYSTDEAEEIEEDPPIMASAPQHSQTAFYPSYGDLSNQSFFFSNDDDPYTGEDQYTNYLAFGQAQSKPQDPASGNFLWC